MKEISRRWKRSWTERWQKPEACAPSCNELASCCLRRRGTAMATRETGGQPAAEPYVEDHWHAIPEPAESFRGWVALSFSDRLRPRRDVELLAPGTGPSLFIEVLPLEADVVQGEERVA